LKILVPCKRVPNPEQKLKLAGSALDLAGTTWQVNPFDEYAVETALRLTEKGKGGAHEGEVVVVAIGPKELSTQVRSLLAMGADRAILVEGSDDNLDSNAVAQILAAVVAQEKPDVVVMGKQTVDGDANQVGQLLAGYLGWPQSTFLAGLTLSADGKTAVTHREMDAGVEEKSVPLPAVLTVDLRIISPGGARNLALVAADAVWDEGPRYAALKGIMAAKKKELKELTTALLGVTPAIRVKTIGHTAPPARKAGVKVDSVAALVDKLHNEAKVL
jgi:electron transfer flavoprotein beta subunit